MILEKEMWWSLRSFSVPPGTWTAWQTCVQQRWGGTQTRTSVWSRQVSLVGCPAHSVVADIILSVVWWIFDIRSLRCCCKPQYWLSSYDPFEKWHIFLQELTWRPEDWQQGCPRGDVLWASSLLPGGWGAWELSAERRTQGHQDKEEIICIQLIHNYAMIYMQTVFVLFMRPIIIKVFLPKAVICLCCLHFLLICCQICHKWTP